MQIIYNGEPRDVPDDLTVAQFVATLQIPTRAIAVELNLEVVPRAKHAQQRLAPGDRVEVVTLVGGG